MLTESRQSPLTQMVPGAPRSRTAAAALGSRSPRSASGAHPSTPSANPSAPAMRMRHSERAPATAATRHGPSHDTDRGGRPARSRHPASPRVAPRATAVSFTRAAQTGTLIASGSRGARPEPPTNGAGASRKGCRSAQRERAERVRGETSPVQQEAPTMQRRSGSLSRWSTPRRTSGWIAVSLVLGFFCAAPAANAQTDFITFESGQVRPLALSPNGLRLLAVNTPDNRLEVFDVVAGTLVRAASIPVGMEPVAVAARTNTEVWVVNHLSDSVSIVDLASTPPRVARTLLVGDEPRD